jgi:rod shape determining protein RodA
MGTLRLQPARVGSLAPKVVTNVWTVFDVQLAFYALALTVIGLMMAYTNSPDAPLQAGSLFTRALVWLALGILAFTLAAAIDYHWLKTLAWPVYFANLALLGVTLAVGTGIGGVSRWVSIFGLQFQFSEVAKILMAVVLANYLVSRRGKMGSIWTIIGAAIIAAPPAVLVLIQPDLGTSLVFGAIVFGALFLSGASLRWLGLAAIAFVAFVPVAWTYVLKDYQRARLISFLDPAADPQGSGYQLQQSQIAVGSGGPFGKGLTSGTGGADSLPVQSTDFAFASLGEHLGFIGAVLVLVLFAALIWRVLVVGWRAKDPFGLAFAGGIAAMLLFQLLINVGMVLGIMPITGIPLPFITHGGASLISVAIGLGILESINMRQSSPGW